MLDPILEEELRMAVNPSYEDVRGTESYERKRLLAEIDRLRTAPAPAIDCRTCTSYVKHSCFSAIKCTNGDMYLGNILIQCWTK